MSDLGVLDVLNVGLGHLKMSFDKTNADEMLRARTIINEMFQRGYAIFVEIDGEPVRARRFDATKDCYIVDEGNAQEAEARAKTPELPAPTTADETPLPTCACGKARGHRGRCLKRQERAIPAATSSATAIARTAGG